MQTLRKSEPVSISANSIAHNAKDNEKYVSKK